ncbi:hypothetical protein Acsp01_38350 [Actinoplanes sp. NBRC 101535]|nr:hypothetical protein Acsp01_38350 [Actinoplanes sp. NBRC 101535]
MSQRFAPAVRSVTGRWRLRAGRRWHLWCATVRHGDAGRVERSAWRTKSGWFGGVGKQSLWEKQIAVEDGRALHGD